MERIMDKFDPMKKVRDKFINEMLQYDGFPVVGIGKIHICKFSNIEKADDIKGIKDVFDLFIPSISFIITKSDLRDTFSAYSIGIHEKGHGDSIDTAVKQLTKKLQDYIDSLFVSEDGRDYKKEEAWKTLLEHQYMNEEKSKMWDTYHAMLMKLSAAGVSTDPNEDNMAEGPEENGLSSMYRCFIDYRSAYPLAEE